MDSQEAKLILEAYRSGMDDAEPPFAEALAQARRDPALARWLQEQTALDAAIRGKLRSVDVPIGLKTRILANAKTEPRSSVWAWLTPAMALLVMVIAVFWLRPTGFAVYRGEMVKFVSVEYKLDVKTGNFEEFRQALAQNNSPSIPALPPALAKLELEGGCLMNWHGHKVTLICLEAKDHDVWLFVAERQSLPDAPPATPVFAKTGKITTASWTADHLTYILATEGDEAELKGYL